MMKRFTQSQLLLLLGLFLDVSFSFTAVPSIHVGSKSTSSTTRLHARFRRKDDDNADKPNRRSLRLSFFSAFSKERRSRAKQVRKMQATAATDGVAFHQEGMNGTWSSVGTRFQPIKSRATPSSIQVGSNGTTALPLDHTSLPSPPTLSSATTKSAGALTRMTAQWFQSILLSILHKHSVQAPQNLQVKAIPKGNVLGNLLKGRFGSNVKMTFDAVQFQNIQLSGGGQIDAKRLALNVWSFTPQLLRQGVYRFPKQFDLVAKNCTLLEADLLESSCIRNGLGRLLKRILKSAGDISTRGVTITAINVLPSNKISILGHATTRFGSRVVFEVRSGIGTCCRGHVVTFPGLEVSLQPALGVFVPVVPSINLDIGHNARLLKVKVNGELQQVSLDAHVSITPQHTIKMNRKYTQSKEAYLAQFSFDVGQWITHIGNFTL